MFYLFVFSFSFFDVSARKFKITYVVYIIFLLESAGLEHRQEK